jgi:hypothetical protein
LGIRESKPFFRPVLLGLKIYSSGRSGGGSVKVKQRVTAPPVGVSCTVLSAEIPLVAR